MAYPQNPEIDYSYTDFQEEQQDSAFPGTQLDNDLVNLVTAIDALNAFVRGVTRSDGKLANQSVGPDQLSAALNVGFTLQGAWVSGFAYSTADGVVYNGNFYRANFAHTSAAGTRPDLSPATWQFLFSIASVSGAMSAATYDPQNKMTDAFARANHTGVEPISAVDGLQTALDTLTTSDNGKLPLAGGPMTGPILDASFAPSAAPTKKAAFNLVGITTGQTRNIRVPDTDSVTGVWEPVTAPIDLTGLSLVDWTNLTPFRELRLTVNGRISVASGQLVCRVSTNNGSTFLSTTADYQSGSITSEGASLTGAALVAQNAILLTFTAMGISQSHFLVHMADFNKPLASINISDSLYLNNSTSVLRRELRHGVASGTTARNALRLLLSAGAFVSGMATLEGLRG